ncbi:MAG: type II toxin-antitoxin system HigB family toxin [Cyanobacteria bacterium SZAS TMP-1]|nr:type II toxin-antitoxin system HigB family toxin [Cyanobacteria bacterium SZAS TMP-1]
MGTLGGWPRKLILIIQNKIAIDDFYRSNASARKSLDAWVKVVEAVRWTKHTDVKKTFSSADLISGSLYIFNVGGNNTRIAANVFFPQATVFVREVMTHSQYSKKKFK